MISARNVSFQYRFGEISIEALGGVDLDIYEGEALAIIGPNGSGKTTFVRCLNGLLIPTSGTISVDGLEAKDESSIWEIRRKVGMVFQNPEDQIVSTELEREIAFGLENLGIPQDEIRRRVDEAIERFGLGIYRHTPPHHLSGGEMQRLAVASVWAMRPKYVVLDEPNSLLDPEGRREMESVISELRQDQGTSVIHITQFPEVAARYPRVVVISDGKVRMDGSPDDVFSRGEEILKMGLDLPFPTKLCLALRGLGIDIGDITLSEDNLAARLSSIIRDEPGVPASTSEGPENLVFGKTKISLKEVSYVYDAGLPTEKSALRDVSLELHDGETLALIGPSGSGKSTLVQHMNGLIRPTRGRVYFDGNDLWSDGGASEARRRVGLVFQFPEFQLFEETVAKDVAFAPKNFGLSTDEVERRVREALEAVELDFPLFATRPPLALSSGEKRRVAIAGVLAMDPEVIIFDEPTAGLDPSGSHRVLSILRRLKSMGKSLVVISHDMDLVAEVADRVALMKGGAVVRDGSPGGIFYGSTDPGSSGPDLPKPLSLAMKVPVLVSGSELPPITLDQLMERIASHREYSSEIS